MKLKKSFPILAITVAVGGLIAFAVWASAKADENRPGESFPSLGGDHIAVGASHPAYNSNPPTSGWHYAQEAAWGVHSEELSDEQVLHNLEHGGIWISYTGIDQDTQTKIEDLVKRYPDKLIVTPRAKDDSKIAVASWGRLMKLDQYDEAKIVEFIAANKNKSPEPTAQ